MAKIGIHEVDGLVRVGRSVDHKGNPAMVLEILGVPVRYAREGALGDFPEDWADVYRERLASVLADLVVFDDQQTVWQKQSPTGREVYPLEPTP
jgi:hypothetical protein